MLSEPKRNQLDDDDDGVEMDTTAADLAAAILWPIQIGAGLATN